jgi:hypothetical protein
VGVAHGYSIQPLRGWTRSLIHDCYNDAMAYKYLFFDDYSEGALGTSVNRKGKLKTLTVGTVTIDSAPVSFRGPNSGLDEAPFDGLLGNDFFKDFVVTFDYRSMAVMFEKLSAHGEA